MKSLVRKSFSRFSKSYEKEAVLQKEAASILAEISYDMKGSGLDLGCGTGFLYEFLKEKNITGIDISPDMAFFYRKKNQKVIIGDMENLPFKENCFDFVLSNFSIHWTDIKTSFKEVYRVLKKGGYFIFNIPFQGSLEIIEEILGEETFKFLCVPEILKTLKEAGFSIEDFFSENLEKTFPDGYSLLSHLHKTGVSINPEISSLQEKRKIVSLFKNYKKEATLTYRVLFVRAYKG